MNHKFFCEYREGLRLKSYICIMIMELEKHIENLLLENDCVIIPGFGGFIVQYISARRIKENIFLPPYRTVRFNSQLNLNDGLLIQSYMQIHDVSYPEALRLVEDAVAELRELLSKSGEVVIHGVGKLVLDIENTVIFCPNEDGVFSPSFYGLGSFEVPELSKEKSEILAPFIEESVINKQKHNTLIIRINKTWLNNAVSVAVAILLFFFLSTPVDNTYVEPENYASFGDIGLFDHIRSQSVATSLVKVAEPENDSGLKQSDDKLLVANTIQHKGKATGSGAKDDVSAESQRVGKERNECSSSLESNVIVSGEVGQMKNLFSVERSLDEENKKELHSDSNEEPEEILKETIHYHIIVASVTNMVDAKKTIQFFTEKGFPGGTVVKGDGRVRIAISSFTDRKEADAKWTNLRKIELFQNAWILTSRDK